MMRSRSLAFGLAVAAICAFAWFAFDRREDASESTSERAPGAHVKDEASGSTAAIAPDPKASMLPVAKPAPAAGSKELSTGLANSELPDFLVPPDQAIARLRVLADAGNGDARYELSRRLANCTARALRATQESDERDRQSLELDKTIRTMDVDQLALSILVGQDRIDRHVAERAACAALPEEVRENWIDPIDQLAQSGKTYAMRQYAAFVVAEYDSRDAVVADVDRAIVRRDKARAYLRKAVELGDAEGLADLAEAYFDHRSSAPQLYAIDNYQAYMYAYAASFGPRGQYRNLDWVMSQSAKSLDLGQISNARKQGKLLYDACCRQH